eukprot:scaffold17327_cov67-Attheya_sp.AAC.4
MHGSLWHRLTRARSSCKQQDLYHWCPQHKAWTLHTAGECRLESKVPACNQQYSCLQQEMRVECDMYMEIPRGFQLPAGGNSKDYMH